MLHWSLCPGLTLSVFRNSREAISQRRVLWLWKIPALAQGHPQASSLARVGSASAAAVTSCRQVPACRFGHNFSDPPQFG